MRNIIFILIIVGQLAIADEFDVGKFMSTHNLNLFDLNEMPDQQFFTNHRYVKISSGSLSFSNKWQQTNKINLKIGNVEYVGTNNGEWGGKLEVVIAGERKMLMKGNIVHLLPLDGKLYVIEGLAHLSMASGSVSVIEDIEKPSQPKLITKLPDAPELVYLDNTRSNYLLIVIVGSKSIMSIGPGMTLEILYWDAFWHINLNPTSIVRYKDNYFIGLPHGVAVVPAPWGESSRYCREFVGAAEKNCLKVQFYADHDFNKRVN
jgi:hypothetical protein